MKGVFFLLLISIIASHREITASPAFEVPAVVKKVLQAVGIIGPEKATYDEACKAAAKNIFTYYEEKEKLIQKTLSDTKDCDVDILQSYFKALDSSVKQLAKDIEGDPKKYRKSSEATMKKIDDHLKDISKAKKDLSDDCKTKLEVVFTAAIDIQIKCADIRNAHVETCVKYLKSTGSLLGD